MHRIRIIVNSGGDPVGVLESSPITFWQWRAQMCTDSPTFSAMLLYVACNP